MNNLAVFAPLLWGLTGVVGGSAVNAAKPATVVASGTQPAPAKSVANGCHCRLKGAIAKRDGKTRAQCAPPLADVDQGGGPQSPAPVAGPVGHQAANSAKPGR